MQLNDDLWGKLEEFGEQEVRRLLAKGDFGARKIPRVKHWLEEKERERADAKSTEAQAGRRSAIRLARGTNRATWIIAWATIAIVLAMLLVWFLSPE